MIDLDLIRREWVRRPGDVAAEIAAWDSVAADYVLEDRNNFTDDPFLRFMAAKVPLCGEMDVLDVGCGAGAYACRVAERARSVTGVDFSPEMIRHAKAYAEGHGIDNVSFVEGDWHNGDREVYRGRFDVVFAHTTPAVIDYETFRALHEASRGYCLICKPTRRTDRVFDEVRKIAGVPSRAGKDDMPYMLDALWLWGCCPELCYDRVTWESDRTVEEAEKWYLGRLRGSMPLDAEAEARVKGFLREISKDDVVHETIETTLTSVVWQVGAL